MRRTTISLPDDLAEALDREAHRRALPVSAVAREAIAKHLGFGTAQDQRELPFAAIGRSGRRTTARDMEELLQQEWAGLARRR
jgi:predicted transcriptional regulator